RRAELHAALLSGRLPWHEHSVVRPHADGDRRAVRRRDPDAAAVLAAAPRGAAAAWLRRLLSLNARTGAARGMAGVLRPRHALGAPDVALVALVLVEQADELFGHRATELLGIHNGDGFAVVARDIMSDADGGQFDGGLLLDLLDHPAQMALEVIAG